MSWVLGQVFGGLHFRLKIYGSQTNYLFQAFAAEAMTTGLSLQGQGCGSESQHPSISKRDATFAGSSGQFSKMSIKHRSQHVLGMANWRIGVFAPSRRKHAFRFVFGVGLPKTCISHIIRATPFYPKESMHFEKFPAVSR